MDEFRNLLLETLEVLKENGLSPADVRWIGNDEVYFDWSHFEKIANIDYEVALGDSYNITYDIMIVGDNWWMERENHGGGERWSFKTLPQKPATPKNVTKIISLDTSLSFADQENNEIVYDDTKFEKGDLVKIEDTRYYSDDEWHNPRAKYVVINRHDEDDSIPATYELADIDGNTIPHLFYPWDLKR